jgi:hypothetical protein
MAQGQTECVPRPRAWWRLALIAMAAVTVSCAPAPPKPSVPTAAESMRTELGATDEILANAVYTELNANPTYYFRHVDVRVDNGVADLSGYVWSTDAIYAARKIASKVPGVTSVRTSQLQLERNGRDNSVTR